MQGRVRLGENPSSRSFSEAGGDAFTRIADETIFGEQLAQTLSLGSNQGKSGIS
jgi:hypothetical protein